MSQATVEDEDTAMDTHDLKLSIPESSADGARSGSPESGVSTPRYSEQQSGSKRLRTKDGWEEVEGGSDPDSGGPNRDDEPGTSAGMLNVSPAEVGLLMLRTKTACSELADVIVRLERERYAHERPPRFAILNRVLFPRPRAFEDLVRSRSEPRVLPRGPRPALTPASRSRRPQRLDRLEGCGHRAEARAVRPAAHHPEVRDRHRTRAVPETREPSLRSFFFSARRVAPPPTARHIAPLVARSRSTPPSAVAASHRSLLSDARLTSGDAQTAFVPRPAGAWTARSRRPNSSLCARTWRSRWSRRAPRRASRTCSTMSSR